MELNKIYNEDCLIGMKEIPDKSIDMILCDLPYGTTRNKWDAVIPLEWLWDEYNRVIKDNGAIVLTAQTPFDKVLGTSNLKMLRYEWIWDKVSPTGYLNAKKMPMKKTENILVFYKKLPTYNAQGLIYNPRIKTRSSKSVGSSSYGTHSDSNFSERSGYPTNLIKFKREFGLHPTQKPVTLFEYLIKTYTNEGETVLDNCMGSGTTAIAAINTNRNYLGFELDEKYFELANDRIEKHNKQMELFEKQE
ncbi:DNA-methyltransferase [Staphylococcus saprophyticus]|uniref:DNA-methyltransferase n=1 Tax=Staphylococcus saprophyticus TaxID=29385 RepID=UPI0021A88291|nr:site-specific DNA-methyltransferase [Staphylococcus saprophyticus]MCT1652594.1 site-specific DNA-methyltransferase [Staphylococcus saprophyticus]